MTTSQSSIGAPGPAAIPLRPIANAGRLLGAGLADLRRIALDVAAAGIRAADPAAAVERLVDVRGGTLLVGDLQFSLGDARSVIVLGAGKASVSIASAIEAKLGDHVSGGLVIRRRGEVEKLRRIDVADADHPVPSEASLEAGRRLMDAAAQVRPGDLVITAFTGGSSALACAPPDGVPFSAKQRLHRLLLASGAPITEVNTVRKHVSALKGGRLAAAMSGATVLNLTLSDVAGDAPELLCDPVVQDTSDAEAAVRVLRRYGIWREVGPEIRGCLTSPAAASPVLNGQVAITTVVLLNGRHVATQMAARARALGWEPVILGSTFEGEAGQLGGLLGSFARESALHGHPFRPGSVLVGAGGESTVTLRGQESPAAGHGGPNQQLAMTFARAIDAGGESAGSEAVTSRVTAGGEAAAADGGRPAVAGVFIDSDGSDGGTDAAGGCVDATTALRARLAGIDLDAAIACYDSYPVLRQLGDLVVTGSTGTNVSDLWTIVIGPPGTAGTGGTP